MSGTLHLPRVGGSAPRASACLLAGLVCAVNLALVLRYSPDFASTDAAQYMSEARNIISGRGFATDIAYYDEHHRLGRVPVPQTVFPPGYPLAIAAVAATGIQLHLAAFVVCLVAFNLVVALTCAGVRHASTNPDFALLAGIVAAGSVTSVLSAMQCAAEMPFVASTLVGLVCVQRLPRGGLWLPLLAGVSAAAAVSVRYAGIFFLAALGLVMLARLARLRSRRSLAELVLALAPGTLTLLALFTRNYLLVGDIKGGNAYEVSRPVTDVMAAFKWAAQGLVGYSQRGLETGRPQEMFVIGVVVALAGLALAARPQWSGDLARRLQLEAGPALALAYVAVSLGALWSLERTRHLGVASRMLLPLVPFFLVLAATAATAVHWRRPRLRSGTTVLVMAAAYLVGQASLLPPEHLIQRAGKVRGLRLALGRSPEVRQLLSRDEALGRALLTNEAQHVGALLAQPVVGLTSPAYSGTRWTADVTERLIRRYGVRHVVFFRRAFADQDANEPEETDNQDFFRSLARSQAPDWLSPVHADADLLVFEVRE